MMQPITFTCAETFIASPSEISSNLLNLDKWCEFEGYGIMPGIKVAVFERETPEVIGSIFRVSNSDGSTHTEEIVEWEPETRICLRMENFSPPLSRLSSHFLERWTFTPNKEANLVTRSFELHPKHLITKPALWLISFLLKKAIARQLQQMQDEFLNDKM
ncbi:SRPBCC family protein [bacterium]|nr:SRPBCC family protein [bacterium]MDB4793237.1 SRPBCC family protein [bacterium]